MEKAHIEDVLTAASGNIREPARILGLHRDTLYRKIRRFSAGWPAPPKNFR
jgi:transcriptional regulator of acetoin/glycerol metabolism